MLSTIFALLKTTPLTRFEQASALGISEDKMNAWVKGRTDYAGPTREHLKRAVLLVKRHIRHATEVIASVNPSWVAPVEAAPVPTMERHGSLQRFVSAAEMIPLPRGLLAERLGVSRRRLDAWFETARAPAGTRCLYRHPTPEVYERCMRIFELHVADVDARRWLVAAEVYPWEA